MRPRVKSYGESSTATLSPGRMRMKFLRIFPETCASTWCLFSSSTLNMALGSGSTTVAITSIASSLLIDSLKSASSFWLLAKSCGFRFKLAARSQGLAALLRQNHRTIFRDRHTMLKVRAVAAVGRYGGPLVVEHPGPRTSRVHHGLDRQHHTLSQARSVTARTVVRHLRLFVQAGSDAVSYKFPDHAEAV